MKTDPKISTPIKPHLMEKILNHPDPFKVSFINIILKAFSQLFWVS